MRRAERGGIIMRLLSLLMFLAFLALIYVVRHPLDRHVRLIVKINTDPRTPSNESMNIGTSKFMDSAAVFDHPTHDSGVRPCHSRRNGTSANPGIAESTTFKIRWERREFL